MKFTKILSLKLMLSLLCLVIMFHLAIITQVIPYTIVWAGRLKSLEEMYTFETVSIAVNIFMIAILLLKLRFIRRDISSKVLDVILWLLLALFALNTIGNLLAKSLFEKVVFSPLTFLFTVLIWMILRKEQTEKTSDE